MAGILIRMKLAIIRHSLTGGRAALMVTGGVIGLIFAGATIWLSVVPLDNLTVVADLLGAVFLIWMLAWIVGPVWGGSPVLRVDHFALLSVPRRRLAVGLLAAAFVGITTLVTAVAFVSLIVYATRLGVAPALVALPAAALQLVFVVLLSRVATAAFGVVAKSRVGAALIGLLVAAMIVLSQSGWMVAVAIQVSGVVETGFGPAFATTVRAVPSGWGLYAVEAAGRGDWLFSVGALVAMAALIVLLLLGWSRTLGTPRRARVVIRGSDRAKASARGVFAGPAGAVRRKELRTWWRDPLRTQTIAVPIVWGLGTALLPLSFGEKVLLPWAAPAIAVMAASSAANLYGQDGTALWMTLLTGTERADIRARQWAFLLIFGPVTVIVGVVFTLWSGLTWAWPWVFALLPAALGGGVGLSILISVVALAPGPDAHKRPSNPLEHGDTTGQANLLFWAGLVMCAPAGGVVLAGTLLHNEILRWAGVPVGIVTGVVLAWWLGRVAIGRLRVRGPEMLFLMRTGRSTNSTVIKVKVGKLRSLAALLGWTLGSIALFPQGLVPVIFLLLGLDVKVWFLAMYLESQWQWPCAIAMVVLGSFLYYIAIKATVPKKPKPAEEESEGAVSSA